MKKSLTIGLIAIIALVAAFNYNRLPLIRNQKKENILGSTPTPRPTKSNVTPTPWKYDKSKGWLENYLNKYCFLEADDTLRINQDSLPFIINGQPGENYFCNVDLIQFYYGQNKTIFYAYNNKSVEPGHGGYSSFLPFPYIYSKTNNVSVTYYLDRPEEGTLLGESPVLVRFTKNISPAKDKPLYLSFTQTLIEKNDPDLRKILNKYKVVCRSGDKNCNSREIDPKKYTTAVKEIYNSLIKDTNNSKIKDIIIESQTIIDSFLPKSGLTI